MVTHLLHHSIGKNVKVRGNGRNQSGKKGPVKAEDLDRDLGLCESYCDIFAIFVIVVHTTSSYNPSQRKSN